MVIVLCRKQLLASTQVPKTHTMICMHNDVVHVGLLSLDYVVG